jgi:hypothetical protein
MASWKLSRGFSLAQFDEGVNQHPRMFTRGQLRSGVAQHPRIGVNTQEGADIILDEFTK